MILSEYRALYEQSILDQELKQKDRNELIRLYVKTGEEKYLSAAVYKFWYVLNNKVFNNKNNKFISPEDFYSLYIDSILDTCTNKVWEDENHSLYKDEKAPEKSINTIFNSKVINYFHACNRQKRVAMFERVTFDVGESIMRASPVESAVPGEDIKQVVVDFFYRKDYYSAYILDMILNENVFEFKDEKLSFSQKKLKHCLMTLDDSYYDYFSEHYNIEKEKVDFSRKYIDNISYNQADREIARSIGMLYANNGVINYIRNRGE